jgi:hypothetical protein
VNRQYRPLADAGETNFEQWEHQVLRHWHRARAQNLECWLSLRTELLLYALRNPSFRPRMADRERIALRAHRSSLESAATRSRSDPPASPDFLALIVHALEDGLLLQRMLSPDEISDEVVVDAAELLLKTWPATPNNG